MMKLKGTAKCVQNKMCAKKITEHLEQLIVLKCVSHEKELSSKQTFLYFSKAVN